MYKSVLLFIVLLLNHSNCMAGGRTASAVPTEINTIRSEGVIIYGAFGNPGACDKTNTIWIPRSHAEYDKLYSTALGAFMGGKKVSAYIHSCVDIPWLAGTEITYNQLTVGDFRIRN